MKSRRRNQSPPPRGTTESFEMVDAGEPRYFVAVPPARSVVAAVPGDRYESADAPEPLSPEQARAGREARGIPDPNRSIVPTPDEVAALPASARAAFAARCAARVASLRNGKAGDIDAQTAAALIVSAATVRSRLRRQVRSLRRDFDRLKRHAREHNWGDDTPVPPDVFGALWPEGQTPAWALPK